MKTESGYKTRQRAMVLSYLESMGGEHVTAKSVHGALAKSGKDIGAATVYRQLDRLVDEGLARRYTLGQGQAACYEYIGGDASCEHKPCFHCMCIDCGRLFHMECGHLNDVAKHLSADHGFTIDSARTVFYGLCVSCEQARQAKGV